MTNMMINQASGSLGLANLSKSIDPKFATMLVLGVLGLKFAEMVMHNGYEFDFKADADGIEAHLRKPENSAN
ncbi:hypothetical protein [Bifidobacterium tissieri]|uniref:hypothetical protein n=1 Tax=Bifidobacterium tissieri TaxID=1630162 RepID=UPI00123B66A1|nr:hypothetical protein [Bifidobacterium tissieri]KAA8830183.1 hypothetical protein EM849_10415 [Bifidobacterium tissieri]